LEQPHTPETTPIVWSQVRAFVSFGAGKMPMSLAPMESDVKLERIIQAAGGLLRALD
jgi:hypothetical protein